MGKNAAFGRPSAGDRVRHWWDGKSKESRSNTVIGLVVAFIVCGLLVAATTRSSKGPSTGLAALANPHFAATSVVVPSTSTPPSTIPGATSTTSSPTSSTTTRPGSPTTTTTTTGPARPTAATGQTTVPPGASVTIGPNPNVIFSDPPAAPPTSQLTSPTPTPAPTLGPTATTTPAPTSTTAPRPATTTTVASGLPPLPVALPLLSGPA